jgi:hypothetical protein
MRNGSPSGGNETHPAPVSDVAGIRDRLSDILGSAHFRQSRQSRIFLSYVVEHSLAGETELLRETLIFSTCASSETPRSACLSVETRTYPIAFVFIF